jgi:hypothetical protein
VFEQQLAAADVSIENAKASASFARVRLKTYSLLRIPELLGIVDKLV